jgi:1-deoxy-D-xylulose-5-phosphate reductoisomerase
MNKGLEVIEAKHLFGVSHDMIKVVIHPQSVIHSMVAYRDGAVVAQLGIPDMKGAIAYAISYPERLPLKQLIPDFVNIGALTFQQPDLTKFPCLALAFKACEIGGTMPAVLNASNEVAVEAFLDKRISFTNIPELIKNTIEKHSSVKNPTLSDILEADKWGRKTVEELIKGQGMDG